MKIQLLRGLPVTALMFVCPGLAAVILARRESGPEGAKALLKRVFDHERIKAKLPYAPILLLNPAISVLSYAVLRLVGTPALRGASLGREMPFRSHILPHGGSASQPT